MDWYFDIETQDWDVFVCGVAYSEDGQTIVFETEDDVKDWFFRRSSDDTIWAHNGGAFDFLFLISIHRELRWTARMAGASIVSCQPRGGPECRDTIRLFPGSLATWTGRKEPLGLECICGRSCGGYCAIRKDMPVHLRKRLIEYNRSDCVALGRTLQEDLHRLDQDGLSIFHDRTGKPRLTLGGVAWATAAAMCGLDPKAIVDWDEYDFGRLAYYGGRCEVGRVRCDAPAYRYDVNAMYPWALTGPVPHGTMRGIAGESACARAYLAERHGAYHATVLVPDTDIPLLPYRHTGKATDHVTVTLSNGDRRRMPRITHGRLVWATGVLTSWWTQIELAAAERHGATIVSIDMAMVWDQYEPIFEPYVRHIYDRREAARAIGDDRWASILKWYANSLTGKLAQHPYVSTLAISADPPDEGWELVDRTGNMWAKTDRRLLPNCQPIKAAYLTSRSRAESLLPRLFRHSGRWLYCDTDATYIMDRDDRDVDPSQLGKWKYEGEAHDWQALAPKLYRYRDEDGDPVVRARGISGATWETIDRLDRGERITLDRGVMGLRHGPRFQRKSLTRSYRDRLTGRCGTRHVLPDGTTRPLRRDRDGTYR